MMRVTGLAASEVGSVVGAQYGLTVDGNEGLDGEVAEIGFTGELTIQPGLVGALCVGFAIIVDFHGVFLFKVNKVAK